MATLEQGQRNQAWVSHALQVIIIIVSIISFLSWREHVTTVKLDTRFEKIDIRLDTQFEKIDSRLDDLNERVARIEGLLLREKGVALTD